MHLGVTKNQSTFNTTPMQVDSKTRQKQRKLFEQKSKVYKDKIEELKKEINTTRLDMNKNKRLSPYLTLKSAMLSIAYANTYLLMSNLSERVQNVKNNSYLDQARKQISGCLNDLTRIFGEKIDAPLTENQKLLEKIQDIKLDYKLRFIKEMHTVIRSIKENLGMKSKLRWSFPDMHYRHLTFAKNWYDFKLHQSTLDPRNENFRVMREYVEWLMAEAKDTAQEFRSRYELSTHRIDDLYKVRDIFEMQKQMCILHEFKEKKARIQTSLDNIREKIKDLQEMEKKQTEASLTG